MSLALYELLAAFDAAAPAARSRPRSRTPPPSSGPPAPRPKVTSVEAHPGGLMHRNSVLHLAVECLGKHHLDTVDSRPGRVSPNRWSYADGAYVVSCVRATDAADAAAKALAFVEPTLRHRDLMPLVRQLWRSKAMEMAVVIRRGTRLRTFAQLPAEPEGRAPWPCTLRLVTRVPLEAAWLPPPARPLAAGPVFGVWRLSATPAHVATMHLVGYPCMLGTGGALRTNTFCRYAVVNIATMLGKKRHRRLLRKLGPTVTVETGARGQGCWDAVLAGLRRRHGDRCWVTDDFERLIRARPEFVTFALRDACTGVVVAGELGYLRGRGYMSMTGFCLGHSRGTLQILRLGQWLREQHSVTCINLTQPMPYKTRLGACHLTPEAYVQFWQQAVQPRTPV